MRKVIYGVACSLDGLIAGPDDALDWLHFSKDVEAVMTERWATADTLLFGRKTWEYAASQGGFGGRGLKSYVFSRTLATLSMPGFELVIQDAGGFVREMKTRPGGDILVMSGGNFARSLFQAGVIDEVELNIHPVLLGSGTPAFSDAGTRINLELTESRTMDGGCVLVGYRVKS